MADNEQPVENEIIKLSADIARYLHEREGAADTFEGLVSWWLFRAQLSEAEKKVQQAVDYLDQQGLISKRKLMDGTVLYSAKTDD